MVLVAQENNMTQEDKITAEQYIKQQQGYLRQLLWLINASRIGELHTLKTKDNKK
jgi:hypothetical protein